MQARGEICSYLGEKTETIWRSSYKYYQASLKDGQGEKSENIW